MTLATATVRGRSAAPEGSSPFDPRALAPLVGKAFLLTPDDDWVERRDEAGHAYLHGADLGWREHPEYMDFVDPDSPIRGLKEAERDLVWHHWERWVQGGRVLDVGCGIGRFTLPLLDRGYEVVGVDADLASLQRLVWHAAGRNGALDVHWSSVHTLPEGPFDLAIASEVLCYVPDTVGALATIRERLAPGGRLLLSMEARWGWALSEDAPEDALAMALSGDGVIDLPGERWVRTVDEPTLRALLAEAGFQVDDMIPSHWVPDGPLEALAPPELSLEELLAFEARCRAHPVFGPLHRLWLVSARPQESE